MLDFISQHNHIVFHFGNSSKTTTEIILLAEGDYFQGAAAHLAFCTHSGFKFDHWNCVSPKKSLRTYIYIWSSIKILGIY